MISGLRKEQKYTADLLVGLARHIKTLRSPKATLGKTGVHGRLARMQVWLPPLPLFCSPRTVKSGSKARHRDTLPAPGTGLQQGVIPPRTWLICRSSQTELESLKDIQASSCFEVARFRKACISFNHSPAREPSFPNEVKSQTNDKLVLCSQPLSLDCNYGLPEIHSYYCHCYHCCHVDDLMSSANARPLANRNTFEERDDHVFTTRTNHDYQSPKPQPIPASYQRNYNSGGGDTWSNYTILASMVRSQGSDDRSISGGIQRAK